MRRHGARAEIVAVGEPARQYDQVARRNLGIAMPHHRRRATRSGFQRHRRVAVAIRSRKNDDARFHVPAISLLSSPGLTGRSSNRRLGLLDARLRGRDSCLKDSKKTSLVSSRFELIGVILYDSVGEELLAHALDFRAGAAEIALGHLDLDIFALAHVANRAEAECMQRAGDGFALRIEQDRKSTRLNSSH